MSRLAGHLHSFIRLVLKANCPLCDRSTDADFCPDCQRQLQDCGLPQPVWQDDLTGFAWGRYNSTLKRAIAALKYNNQPQLAQPLGHWLAEAWNQTQPTSSKLLVVPIPMHADKRKKRGFNQAELIAQAFCDLTHLPLASQGLLRQRETEAMYHLAPTARIENLTNAFCLGKAFEQRRPTQPILLLDDIYTTGATARSAIQTLRRHGIRVWGIAVVARAALDQQQPKDNRI